MGRREDDHGEDEGMSGGDEDARIERIKSKRESRLTETSDPPRGAQPTTQIRRSSYHNVVRVQDVYRLMDVSSIQTYIINSARVVFLNERPHPRSNKGKDDKARSERTRATTMAHSECAYCARILQSENNNYCSISCKMNGGDCMVPKEGVDMSFAEETIKPTPRKSTQTKSAKDNRRGRKGSPASDNSSKSARSRSPVSVKSEDEPTNSSHGGSPILKIAAGALLVGSKRKHPTSRGDAPTTPAPLLITPSVLHRRKSRPKKSPVGDH